MELQGIGNRENILFDYLIHFICYVGDLITCYRYLAEDRRCQHTVPQHCLVPAE